MKRRMSSLLGPAMGLALLLATGPDSLAQTPPPLAVVGDSGIVTLGPNQKLRLTAVGKGSADATVRFRRTTYAEGACDAGVCTHAVLAQTTSAPVDLSQGEGASVEIDNAAFGVRGVVIGTAGVRVLIEVVDETTNGIIAILIGL
jgi:hypothetical protein